VIAAPPPVVPNCITRVAAPRKLTFSCADGNFYLSDLRWRDWGAPVATASGTAHANDCTPYCAAGHFHTYRITVETSRLRACLGRRQYLRLVVHYAARARPGASNPETVDLGCRRR
jgi:hypothetical protein